jgi:hypothetical protein
MEIDHQPRQLAMFHSALRRIRAPVHIVHGDADDFAPIDAAMRLANQSRTRRPIRFVTANGANHFLNDGPATKLIDTLETCLPPPRRAFPWAALTLPRLSRTAALGEWLVSEVLMACITPQRTSWPGVSPGHDGI